MWLSHWAIWRMLGQLRHCLFARWLWSASLSHLAPASYTARKNLDKTFYSLWRSARTASTGPPSWLSCTPAWHAILASDWEQVNRYEHSSNSMSISGLALSNSWNLLLHTRNKRTLGDSSGPSNPVLVMWICSDWDWEVAQSSYLVVALCTNAGLSDLGWASVTRVISSSLKDEKNEQSLREVRIERQDLRVIPVCDVPHENLSCYCAINTQCIWTRIPSDVVIQNNSSQCKRELDNGASCWRIQGAGKLIVTDSVIHRAVQKLSLAYK